MMDPFAHCEMLVRAGDKARFLSALFAPAQHRAALFALYAFNLEIARIREVVRDPMTGEIRLEWWREVVRGEGRGSVEGHPVVAALRATMSNYGLSAERLTQILDARSFDLGTEPMRSKRDLEAYADATSSNLIFLAGMVLNGAAVSESAELVHHAGVGAGVAGLLKAFPIHARRGQIYLPLEILQRYGSDADEITRRVANPRLCAALAELRDTARQHLQRAGILFNNASPEVFGAFLPVALAGPTLRLMERRAHNPFVELDLAPWRKQWLIWRAAHNPARIFAES